MRSLMQSEPHHLTPFRTTAEELKRFNRQWVANWRNRVVSGEPGCKPGSGRIVGKLSLERR